MTQTPIKEWLQSDKGRLNPEMIVCITNRGGHGDETIVTAADGNEYAIQTSALNKWLSAPAQ